MKKLTLKQQVEVLPAVPDRAVVTTPAPKSAGADGGRHPDIRV